MAALIDRRAFSDFHGLDLLGQGKIPSITETRRRIFITERRTDLGRPDHFYKGYLQYRLGSAGHVSELPRIVLGRLAERYLERRDGRVVVQYDQFGDWHQLLPFISPLAVIVAFLVKEGKGPPIGEDPRPFLAQEIGESALIGPADYALDDLIERKGLYEIHLHLNGSTELDILWPDACLVPDAFYRALLAARVKSPEPSAELYEQMEPGLTPLILYRRLRAARRVRRQVMAEIAAGLRASPVPRESPWGIDALRAAMEVERSDLDWPVPPGPALSVHPVQALYQGSSHAPLIEEAGWLYACLSTLKRTPYDVVVGTGLYFNLLVLTQVARLSVQQADEIGFDQFQKYTFVGTRDLVERSYEARFRQLNGQAPFNTLAHLEGRFAPKDTVAETRRLVARIVEGYLAFRGCQHRHEVRGLHGPAPPCLIGRGCKASPCNLQGRPDAEFVLVAHFIKKPPKLSNDVARRCHDSDLRLGLHAQARVVRKLIHDNYIVRSLLRGVDGASNELHAPPEPFAPAFRIARWARIARATFHAGEDFRHLLSGIRAVAEALAFLDLRAGDRIGHATALGIAPELWLSRTAPRSVLSQLDLLDDAVFAHRTLATVAGFERDMLKLESLVATYSEAIYSCELGPELLHRAWKLRILDALEVRAVEQSLSRFGRRITADAVAEEAMRLARTAVDEARAAELILIADRVAGAGAAYEIFSRRHALSRQTRQAVEEVEAEIISRDAMKSLQDCVLGEVNRRGVALETLPTSNVRISLYDETAEHHLFRWLGLRGPVLVNRPTVVVGSDDPGVFATNLKNEYAAVSVVLRREFGKTTFEATQILEALNDVGRIRRFPPGGPIGSAPR
jgi:adenosine deaminase